MAHQEKVRYLKTDRGRYYYQRRVPGRLVDLIGYSKWQRPCGKVSFAKATQLVVTWSEEHDRLIDLLSTVEGRQDYRTRLRHEEDDYYQELMIQQGGRPLPHAEDSWREVLELIKHLDRERDGLAPEQHVLLQIQARHKLRLQQEFPVMEVAPFPDVLNLIAELGGLDSCPGVVVSKNLPDPMSDQDYLDGLEGLLEYGFGPDAVPPDDPDDRDEYIFVRKKLERKIDEVAPSSDTITSVSEKYFLFNSIRPRTQKKYRRDLSRLVAITGDVPIKHVEAADLKALRDSLLTNMKYSSVQAVFSPVKGLFSYALSEGLVATNPMADVVLPRDKRPVEERKWHSFEPEEVERILFSAQQIWGHQIPGLSRDRCEAVLMVVRVLAFSGMRPIEVLRLSPDDVDDRMIRVRGSKTPSSTRAIPLHKEISDFPDWLRNGGLDTYANITSDPVSSVRHNFERLIRELMPEPIQDPKKVLYSFRSSFTNAMRRAGAPDQVLRAILGHRESGALASYADGPEFSYKNKWVQASDPRRPDDQIKNEIRWAHDY